ncbi:MAG: S9 family peptidase [Deltaproteobacteria bacterium]|nr:S9 family peptidase [Deltaproteobacteria bacterium]
MKYLKVLPCVLASLALGCPGRGTPAVVAAPRGAPWSPRQGPPLEQLLNVHRAWGPAPSPDGQRVAFLTDATGLPQAHLAPVADAPTPEASWTRLVTWTERTQWVAWNPSGAHLLLGRDHGGDENTQLLALAPTPGAALQELTQAPTVRHLFGGFSRDGASVYYASNARATGDFDVYVRPLAGEARRVFEAPGHHEGAALSDDGRRVVVLEEHGSFNQDLYLVEAQTLARRHLTPHTGDVRFQNPHFTQDGTGLWVLTDQGREYVGLVWLDLSPGESLRMRPAHAPEHDVDLLTATRDGGALATVENVEGYSEVHAFRAQGQALTELPRPQVPRGVVSSLAFSADGRWLFCELSVATSPDEVYRVEVSTGRAQRVTASDHAGLAEGALVEPTVERVRSFDGLEVPLFLYRPRDLGPGERAPVVVHVHGGPEGQATPYFNPVIQFLVGHGYIVAAPNVRGSTGYGKRYAHLDDVALREDSVRDLAAVNRWLRTRPDVAPNRIAVMGGSYGGYMTLAAITLDPELWAAACDIVGIANFRTFLERTAPYRRALREAEYGALARDGEVLDRISPIHRVDRIRAPLFVIHGANDPRVPVTEAEQIVEALRARHQRVEYVRFENEGHGIFRRENRIRAYGELVRFFDEVLR